MKGLIKSRFVWADGYVDHRRAMNHSVWRRFRWDRDDINLERRKDLLSECLNDTDPEGKVLDVVIFARFVFDDGSFEFREVN